MKWIIIIAFILGIIVGVAFDDDESGCGCGSGCGCLFWLLILAFLFSLIGYW